jgi:hypothetical protein
MSHERIDQLNILFIIVSLAMAIWLPFELFLFSYAVLGPLHYLTEINWLRQREYFVEGSRSWIWLFGVLALLVAIFPISKLLGLEFGMLEKNNETGLYSGTLVVGAFLYAASTLFLRNKFALLLNIPLALALAYVLTVMLPLPLMAIGILLPTLMHVYLFTLFFMVFGLLKTNSIWGWASVLLLLLCPILIFFVGIDGLNMEAGAVYNDSEMPAVNYILATIWNGLTRSFPSQDLLRKFQVFIAFAYTYHYLNWFSKTSIIGWRKSLSKRTAIFVGVVWILSVSLYLYDYKTGFTALFFLSFLHVFLEFPLNWVTMRSIALRLVGRRT